MMLYSQQRSSVAEETIEQIIAIIHTGQYSPGDRLPGERKLAEQLQVGRTSVREAMRQLATMGLVESRHGLGTFVKDPSNQVLQSTLISHAVPDQGTLHKLFDLREIIETEAAARAAQNATSNQKAIMRKWVEAVETHIARKDADSMIIADAEFHRQIIIATGNDILVNLMDSIVGLLRDMRSDSIKIPELLPKIITGHRAILVAIETGDKQASRQAMQDHLADVSTLVKAYWVKK